MTKILIIFGTRPEVIKLAPLIRRLKRYPKDFKIIILNSGQHLQMVDELLKLFQIKPDFGFNLMKKSQSLEYVTTTVLSKLTKIIKQIRPHYLVVQGDTTTAMAAALAAFYQKIKVVHIEAGLRTDDNLRPFPEEVNRRVIDSVSSLYFAHTVEARNNLVREGVSKDKIAVTGNTVIDSLFWTANQDFSVNGTLFEKIPARRKLILATAHRRENHGPPLKNICLALRHIALSYDSEVFIIFPMHLNPKVQTTAKEILKGIKNIMLINPTDYATFVQLMKASYLILSDSGGIQEEAPSLKKPVLVLRSVTERPEILALGGIKLVGTDENEIVTQTIRLLEDKKKYDKMVNLKNPYGDGKASERIVTRLIKEIRTNEKNQSLS
ncbi:MAG: UDP-N-acetylglucosamine 2-epimerase (non-hydrolyzing) [Actinobacteria bacterium]|nr:UDP-N-acetylglucosamine 2-epimerase (non-hydrolyzing) [Actinomycetota bacterium]